MKSVQESWNNIHILWMLLYVKIMDVLNVRILLNYEISTNSLEVVFNNSYIVIEKIS